MKKNERLDRINDEIMRECSQILRAEIKDPRVQTLVMVTKAETTSDLNFCKIHVSVMGTDEQKKSVLDGIRSATGFIRKQLAERINLRQTPSLTFLLDDSLEHGMKISKLIDEANKPKESGADGE
jgi:ribosome-binding factor A